MHLMRPELSYFFTTISVVKSCDLKHSLYFGHARSEAVCPKYKLKSVSLGLLQLFFAPSKVHTAL